MNDSFALVVQDAPADAPVADEPAVDTRTLSLFGDAPALVVGDEVESGERGTAEHDRGTVLAVDGDAVVVSWREAGESYTEDAADLRTVERSITVPAGKRLRHEGQRIVPTNGLALSRPITECPVSRGVGMFNSWGAAECSDGDSTCRDSFLASGVDGPSGC